MAALAVLNSGAGGGSEGGGSVSERGLGGENARAAGGGFQAVRRLRGRGCQIREEPLLLLYRGRRKRLQETPHPLAQRRFVLSSILPAFPLFQNRSFFPSESVYCYDFPVLVIKISPFPSLTAEVMSSCDGFARLYCFIVSIECRWLWFFDLELLSHAALILLNTLPLVRTSVNS